MAYLVLIVMVVGVLFIFMLSSNSVAFSGDRSGYLELVWTLLPLLLLIVIAVPRITYLYWRESATMVAIRIKVVGNQWFWSYSLLDFDFKAMLWFELDSYLIDTTDMKLGSSPLLHADQPLTVPIGVPIQFLVRRNDVLHSWTLPVLGIKVDGIPGVVSIVVRTVNYPGTYFGMCRELCGAYPYCWNVCLP